MWDFEVKPAFAPGFAESAAAYFTGTLIDGATFLAILTYVFQQYGARSVSVSQFFLLGVATMSLPFQALVLTKICLKRGSFTGAMFHFVMLAAVCFFACFAIRFGWPAGLVWVAFALLVCLCNSYKQVVRSILPSVALNGKSLAAQNVVFSWTESLARIAAPLLCVLILSRSRSSVGVSTLLLTAGIAAILNLGFLQQHARREHTSRKSGSGPTTPKPAISKRSGPSTEAMASILRRIRPLRTLLLFTYAWYATIGAASVLYLSLAKSSGLGVSKSGSLSSAFGLGGVASLFLSKFIVGRQRIAFPLTISWLVASLAWVGISFVTHSAIAIVSLVAMCGVGAAIASSLRSSLVQRLAPPDAQLRAANVFQMAVALGVASGALIAGISGEVQRACIVTGLLFPVTFLLNIQRIGEIDSAADVPITEIALLRRTSVLGSLNPGALEGLARRCTAQLYPAKAQVIVEGEDSKDVFVITDGEATVSKGGSYIRTMKRGDVFGELAAISNQQRSASVQAGDQSLDVLQIARDDFVNFVGLHDQVVFDLRELMSDRK